MLALGDEPEVRGVERWLDLFAAVQTRVLPAREDGSPRPLPLRRRLSVEGLRLGGLGDEGGVWCVRGTVGPVLALRFESVVGELSVERSVLVVPLADDVASPEALDGGGYSKHQFFSVRLDGPRLPSSV